MGLDWKRFRNRGTSFVATFIWRKNIGSKGAIVFVC